MYDFFATRQQYSTHMWFVIANRFFIPSVNTETIVNKAPEPF